MRPALFQADPQKQIVSNDADHSRQNGSRSVSGVMIAWSIANIGDPNINSVSKLNSW